MSHIAYPVTVTDNPVYLEAQRKTLAAKLEHLNAQYSLEYSELAYGTGRSYDGMPRKQGGIPADITSSIAISKADGIVPEQLRPLYRQMCEVNKALCQLNVKQSEIEQWLLLLDDTERFVVDNHIFRQLSWDKCVELTETQLMYPLSISTLKRRFSAAIDKWNMLYPVIN